LLLLLDPICAQLDRYVQTVLDDPAAMDANTLRSSSFWLLVRAVKEFIAKEGGGVCAPVSQSLPDMHCKTEYYVNLKLLFQQKAEADLKAVRSHLAALLSQLSLPADTVSPQELDSFVRNVRTLRLIRTRSLLQEYGSDGSSDPAKGAAFASEGVREILEEASYAVDEAEAEMSDSAPRRPPNPNNVHWYFALRAADRFLAKEGRAAGTPKAGSDPAVPMPVSQLEADMNALSALQQEIVQHAGLSDILEAPELACLAEVVRSGASEPHVTAAFLGGLASQLGLKLILKQFVPLNNTVLWNGLFASSTTLQM
jgi:amyloid beta precursor protein binding protein 1